MRSSDAKNWARGSSAGADAVDVRRDRGQHVVARQQHALGRVEEAEVVGGVAGRVHRHPLATGERDDLGVLDAPRGPWRREEVVVAHLLEPRPPIGVGHVLLASPRSGAPGVRRGVFERRLVLRRVPPGAERLVRDQLGPDLGPHPSGAAEVVGMRVGDDHGVHPLQPGARPVEPIDEVPPRLLARKARVDDRDAPLVLEGVAVDVAEARHVDRQLHAQHARRDLGDLGGGVFLLLAAGLVHPGRLGRGSGFDARHEHLVPVVPQLGDALPDVVEGAVVALLARAARSLLRDTSAARAP